MGHNIVKNIVMLILSFKPWKIPKQCIFIFPVLLVDESCTYVLKHKNVSFGSAWSILDSPTKDLWYEEGTNMIICPKDEKNGIPLTKMLHHFHNSMKSWIVERKHNFWSWSSLWHSFLFLYSKKTFALNLDYHMQRFKIVFIHYPTNLIKGRDSSQV